MPMTFDMLLNTTLDKMGEKTVLVKTAGHKKAKYTVALGCIADETNLHPQGNFQVQNNVKSKVFLGCKWSHTSQKVDKCKLCIYKVWINCLGGIQKKIV